MVTALYSYSGSNLKLGLETLRFPMPSYAEKQSQGLVFREIG